MTSWGAELAFLCKNIMYKCHEQEHSLPFPEANLVTYVGYILMGEQLLLAVNIPFSIELCTRNITSW